MKNLLIVIDGPAGSGKTTVSNLLAERLGYSYVDTGALYRAIALAAKTAGIASDDDAALEKLCRIICLEIKPTSRGFCLMLDGSEVGERIRTPDISMMASAVSARPVVRRYLLDLQRRIGKQKRCVFEGRDMGTVVFPDADKKFFLDASLKTRAMRRYEQYKSDNHQTPEDVEKDMARRDHNDSTRDIAPLKPAADAIFIDTTLMSSEQVVEKILSMIV